jgi:hypothetical protein
MRGAGAIGALEDVIAADNEARRLAQEHLAHYVEALPARAGHA